MESLLSQEIEKYRFKKTQNWQMRILQRKVTHASYTYESILVGSDPGKIDYILKLMC